MPAKAVNTRPAPRASAGKSIAQNAKETLESIIVAFILAFVFRAFIVEAFVIPTGSMAPTLYGNQFTHTCSNCGYEYAHGITEQDVGEAMNPNARNRYEITLRCPNCDSESDRLDANQIRRPDSGDRILVQKWPWAWGEGSDLFRPARWDVTVFKDPRDGTTNFIKRLIGLPGEVLEILDGDIYTVPLDVLEKAEPGLLARMDQLRLDVARHRLEGRPANRPELLHTYREINEKVLPHLRIARKTERAQSALWANVYNHDYLPLQRGGASTVRPIGWHPIDPASAPAWNAEQREVAFNNPGDAPKAIEFGGKPIDDFVAYNYMRRPKETDAPSYVGDLRLSMVWFRDAGDGKLILQMNRDDHTFIAEITADGQISLTQRHPGLPGGNRLVAQAGMALPPGPEGVPIEFINVDFQVSLRIAGQTVLATRDTDYAPDPQRALALSVGGAQPQPTRVLIGVSRLQGRLRHLCLERDAYYRSSHHPEPGDQSFIAWPGWGTAGMPMLLRPDREVDGQLRHGEYYMLGDNSPASKDSRLWWEIGKHLQYLGADYQLGTVPGDQLLGKAFFVYWPAGYRLDWVGGIGLVPNFGRMRWIR